MFSENEDLVKTSSSAAGTESKGLGAGQETIGALMKLRYRILYVMPLRLFTAGLIDTPPEDELIAHAATWNHEPVLSGLSGVP